MIYRHDTKQNTVDPLVYNNTTRIQPKPSETFTEIPRKRLKIMVCNTWEWYNGKGKAERTMLFFLL